MNEHELTTWRKRLEEVGMHPAWVDQVLGWRHSLGPILTPLAFSAVCAAMMNAGPTRFTVAPDAAEESEALPPVEIPRRVVVKYGSQSGQTGSVVEDGDDGSQKGFFLVEWDDSTAVSPTYASKSSLVVFRLTKTEQARLLLERMAADAWENWGSRPVQKVHYLDRDGRPAEMLYEKLGAAIQLGDVRGRFPVFAVDFPTQVSLETARDTIIRAGLAWWEGE